MSILYRAVKRAEKTEQNQSALFSKKHFDVTGKPYRYNPNDFSQKRSFLKSFDEDFSFSNSKEIAAGTAPQSSQVASTFFGYIMYILSIAAITSFAVIAIGLIMFRDEITGKLTKFDTALLEVISSGEFVKASAGGGLSSKKANNNVGNNDYDDAENIFNAARENNMQGDVFSSSDKIKPVPEDYERSQINIPDRPSIVQLAEKTKRKKPEDSLERRMKNAEFIERQTKSSPDYIRIEREGGKRDTKFVTVNKISPESSSQLNQGYAALISGEYEGALKHYENAMQQNPNDTYALLGHASALHKMGKKLEARLEYENILKRDPTNKEALSNLLALLSSEAPEDALRELLQLSRDYPEYSPIAAQIGLLHASRGAYPQALVFLERAVRLDPNNLSYLYNYAVLLDSTERWEAAAGMYNRLLYVAEKSRAGHSIPLDQVRNRLNFLTSADEKEEEFKKEQQLGMTELNDIKG